MSVENKKPFSPVWWIGAVSALGLAALFCKQTASQPQVIYLHEHTLTPVPTPTYIFPAEQVTPDPNRGAGINMVCQDTYTSDDGRRRQSVFDLYHLAVITQPEYLDWYYQNSAPPPHVYVSQNESPFIEGWLAKEYIEFVRNSTACFPVPTLTPEP